MARVNFKPVASLLVIARQLSKTFALTLGLIAFSFLFVWYIFAWTEPTAVPPGDNVPAPLNVGPDAQAKEGMLWLAYNPAVTTGLIVEYGNIGIGTADPTGLLNLRGYLGGTAGSALAAHTKNLVIGGGNWNQPYNSGNANLLWIGDYSNDAGDDVYPIYVEDENNVVEFFLHSGTTGSAAGKKAYFAGNVGIGIKSPAFKLDVYSSVANNARIGRAEIGGWPANSGYAYFGNQNLNHAVAGNYAILQSTGGTTYVNAASGNNINFRINNADKMRLQSDGRLRLFGSNAGMWVEAGTNDWFVGRSGSNLRFYNAGDRFTITPAARVRIGNQPSPRWNNSLSAYVVETKHHYAQGAGDLYLGEANNTIRIRGKLDIGLNHKQCSVSVSPNSWRTGYCTCPAGKNLIAGGCSANTSELLFKNNYPRTAENRWACYVYNPTGSSAQLNTYAICARVE